MVASDESYCDPTNLQSKLQKHQAFEAELSANKERVDTICKVGYSIATSTVTLHMCSWLSAFQSVHQSLPTVFFLPQDGW